MTGPLLGIAVDGGGTRTRVRLVGPSGETVADGVAGPGNLTYGVDRAWAAIDAAMAATGLRLAAAGALPIVAAMAGSREPELREVFTAARPGAGPVRVVSDGYAAVLGAFEGAPGTVAAIGTGVAVTRLEASGRLRQVDGWGFPIGDEGGGWWLGMRAVRRLLQERDGRAPASDLAGALLGAMGLIDDDDALRAWLRTADATAYAALAGTVVDAAVGGEPVAAAHLDAAAERIGAAIAAIDRPEPAPRVALLGGLAQALRPQLEAGLGARLVTAAGGQLDGAARLLTEPFDETYR